jgi:lipopolysaccharide/colanic/teichoic acid biosynthesis glycosyltransferase
MTAATGWEYSRHFEPTLAPYPRGKRLLDVSLALLLLVALLPVLLVCAAAIKLTSPGPVLFRQTRVGEGGRLFTMLKFRSMQVAADVQPHYEYAVAYVRGGAAKVVAGGEALYKLAADERVTRLGGWLRQTSIDELPQLWNVLRGEMSLVGPRPPLPYETAHYQPVHFQRLAARPGLTGLWQVSGRGRTTFEEMVSMDCDYIRRQCLALDLRILLKTIVVVVRGTGAR